LGEFIPAIVLLVVLAAVVRDDTVFTLCYLLFAVFLVGRWWSRRAFRMVTFKRVFTDRAFPNETVSVKLEVTNTSWLPVVWLSLFDSVMPEVSTSSSFKQVVSLGPRAKKDFSYELHTYKRGYFPVGPLFLQSGDLFGLSDDLFSQGGSDHITVYPRIVPLSSLGLPSRSPLGTLKHTLPIFEDPTRIMGKRDYTPGDSLRRVDWKSTASTGQLQVKQFEPSIALETIIVLDLDESGYDRYLRFDATELAIVVAASVANFVTKQKQTVGLITNAKDLAGGTQPGAAQKPVAQVNPLKLANTTSIVSGLLNSNPKPEVVNTPVVVPARKGSAHLMRLLEVLARAQLNDRAPTLTDLLRTYSVHLAWGTTLVLITGQPVEMETFFDGLFRARRAGLNAVIIFINQFPQFAEVKFRAERFGFPVYQVNWERDMDRWRV
jgi:uncharacterized protein (DUF58 family)